jgi:hypothetical protein
MNKFESKMSGNMISTTKAVPDAVANAETLSLTVTGKVTMSVGDSANESEANAYSGISVKSQISSRKLRIKEMLLQKTGSIMESNIKNGILGTVSPSPYVIIDMVVAATLDSEDRDDRSLAAKDLVVIDLGCGDARWLVQFSLKARDRGSSCSCIGVEIIESQVARAKNLIKASGVCSDVDLVMCDFFSIDLNVANVLIVYLSREGNDKILAKIESECAVGTVVIAVGFQFSVMCIFSYCCIRLHTTFIFYKTALSYKLHRITLSNSMLPQYNLSSSLHLSLACSVPSNSACLHVSFDTLKGIQILCKLS